MKENETDDKYTLKILGKNIRAPSRNRTHDLPVHFIFDSIGWLAGSLRGRLHDAGWLGLLR